MKLFRQITKQWLFFKFIIERPFFAISKSAFSDSFLNTIFYSSGAEKNFSACNSSRSGYKSFYLLRNRDINLLFARFNFLQSFLQNFDLIKQRLYLLVDGKGICRYWHEAKNSYKYSYSFKYLCFHNIISISNY